MRIRIATSVQCSEISFGVPCTPFETTDDECALLVVELVPHDFLIWVLNCVIIGRLLKLAEFGHILEVVAF